MLDLKNVDLLSLQTKQMKQDPTTIALCAALTPYFNQLADEVKLCLVYSRISELDSDVLDELAWQLHIDWYDATAEVFTKRKLIKESIMIHRYRGTAYAVEQLILAYFSDGYVKEWFEYGGDPYTFKVIVRNNEADKSQAQRFNRMLESTKNARSHMSELIIGLICSETLYCSDSFIII